MLTKAKKLHSLMLPLAILAIAIFALVSPRVNATLSCQTLTECLQHSQIKNQLKHEVNRVEGVQLVAKKSRYKGSRGVAHKRPATGNRVFIFNPRRLTWAAYDSRGNLVKSGRASGGRHYCPDVKRACRTPRGYFSVFKKGSAACRSSKYPLPRGGAPMPYCMFFRGGYAIHGSPNVPNYNASHGCIRVLPSAARWLHRNFIRIGTRVIVRPY